MWQEESEFQHEMGDLLDRILNLAKSRTKSGGSGLSAATLESFELLRKIQPAWAIELEEVDSAGIDRRGSFFGGAPYTSASFPWPGVDGGRPYKPLVQLDLEAVGKITHQTLGRGILQLWIDWDNFELIDSQVRVLESADLQEESTLPPAEIDSCYRFELVFQGYMCNPWFSFNLECDDSSEEISDEEYEIGSEIEALTEAHSKNAGDWLFGIPDQGSGAPAHNYEPQPRNLLQFGTSTTFPLAAISRYANIFFSVSADKELRYFFDWNG